MSKKTSEVLVNQRICGNCMHWSNGCGVDLPQWVHLESWDEKYTLSKKSDASDCEAFSSEDSELEVVGPAIIYPDGTIEKGVSNIKPVKDTQIQSDGTIDIASGDRYFRRRQVRLQSETWDSYLSHLESVSDRVPLGVTKRVKTLWDSLVLAEPRTPEPNTALTENGFLIYWDTKTQHFEIEVRIYRKTLPMLEGTFEWFYWDQKRGPSESGQGLQQEQVAKVALEKLRLLYENLAS
jgi:hypothetical protein